MTAPHADTSSAASHRLVALQLVALAWLTMAVQEAFLFARRTPYGEPYLVDWNRYFWYALLYNLLGVALVSLPFQLHWLLRRSPLAPRTARRWHFTHLAMLAAVVVLDHLDNEVMRFMGTHLTVSLVRTYRDVQAWGADNFYAMAGDRGGPYLPLLVLVAMPLFAWVAGRRIIAAGTSRTTTWHWVATWGAVLLPVVIPLVLFVQPHGRSRRGRIQPAVLTLAFEVGTSTSLAAEPPDYPALVQEYQSAWITESGDTHWRFGTDPLHPLMRAPTGGTTPTPAQSWNVIYLQLETFRGWNVGHLNPDPRGSATPYLDSLATSTHGATWVRHLSFGPPTVSGFIAGHCSIRPHAAHHITTTFTYTALACLPALLRERGWRTLFLTGSDPDWDNVSIWLRQWYDEIRFYRDANERDRESFARAAEEIRTAGRAGPFFATVVSITNHYPFRHAEDIQTGGGKLVPAEAIRITMRYTDDAVRQLIESLRQESWFARTLIVVTGDHGYNLGEHDGTAGQRNGWRESVWTPLVIVGAHPRLPLGRHDEVASLLDLAPTVGDLLGLREPVPWLGRSLLTPAGPGRTVTMARDDALYAEDDRFGLVLDQVTGEPALYDVHADPLQLRSIAAQHPAEVTRLWQRALRDQRLSDFLVAANRVMPAATKP